MRSKPWRSARMSSSPRLVADQGPARKQRAGHRQATRPRLGRGAGTDEEVGDARDHWAAGHNRARDDLVILLCGQDGHPVVIEDAGPEQVARAAVRPPGLLPPGQAGRPHDPSPASLAKAHYRLGRGPGDPVRLEQGAEAVRREVERTEAVLDRAPGRGIDAAQQIRYRKTRNQRHRVRVQRRCPALAGPGLPVSAGQQPVRAGDQITPLGVVGRCRLPQVHEPIVPASPAADRHQRDQARRRRA